MIEVFPEPGAPVRMYRFIKNPRLLHLPTLAAPTVLGSKP